jgi:peptidoglycan/LPS O-acetylase OafA/YrhL
MDLGSIVGTIALFAIAYGIFRASRENARESPRARRRALIGSAAMIVGGAVSALWLPTRLPETPGGPAVLVVVALLYVIGFCLVFTGLAALLGAAVAKPVPTESPADL